MIYSAGAERRRTQRSRAKKGKIVLIKADQITIASLIDISDAGVAFQYIHEKNYEVKTKKIDLFSADDNMFIEDIPIETKSAFDITLENKDQEEVTIVRCGVKLGPLNNEQASLLSDFIRKHAFHEQQHYPTNPLHIFSAAENLMCTA